VDTIATMWAKHDPKAAYEWVSQQDNSAGLFNLSSIAVLLEYTKHDMPAVMSIVSDIDDASIDSIIKVAVLGRLAENVSVKASSYEQLISDLNDLLPEQELFDMAISDLARKTRTTNPDSALKLLSQITYDAPLGKDDEIELAGFMLSIHRGGVVKEEKIESYSKEIQKPIVRGVVSNLIYEGDREDAYNWINSLSDDELKNSAVDEFVDTDIERIYESGFYTGLSAMVTDEKQQLSLLVNAVESVITNDEDGKVFIDQLNGNASISEENKALIKDFYESMAVK